MANSKDRFYNRINFFINNNCFYFIKRVNLGSRLRKFKCMKKFWNLFLIFTLCFFTGGCTSLQNEPLQKPAAAVSSQTKQKTVDRQYNGAEYFKPYMEKLQKKIKSKWHPPKGYKTASTVVFFQIDRQGNILNTKVIKSSDIQGYDEAAIKAIKKASPFEPLPAEYKGKTVDVQFNLDYNVYKKQLQKELTAQDNLSTVFNNIFNNKVLRKMAAYSFADKADWYLIFNAYDGAVTYYTKAINYDPANYQYYLDRAYSYLELERYEKALIDVNKVLELKPELWEALILQSVLYQKTKQYSLAVKTYTKALTLKSDSNETDIYLARGVAYYSLKEYDKAIADFDTAIAMNPENSDAYSNKAFCYFEQKQYNKALELFDYAVKLAPKTYENYEGRAMVYYEMKEYQKAVDDMQKAVKLAPTIPEYYEKLATIYEAAGDRKNAALYYNKAKEVKKDPKNDK